MPGLKPATIASELRETINAWLTSAHEYADPESFQFKSLLRSADKLANADGYQASIMRALVHHMAGNAEAADHWIVNARKWPIDPESVGAELTIRSNLGYFSHCAALIDGRGEEVELEQLVSIAMLSGCSRATCRLLAGTTFAETELGREGLELAERCIMTMERIQVSEAQVQAMLDVAGSVLRKHRMFFADTMPVVRVIDDALLYQLKVRLSPEESAVLTDEVLLEMVQRDLDAPGLTFSFIPS